MRKTLRAIIVLGTLALLLATGARLATRAVRAATTYTVDTCDAATLDAVLAQAQQISGNTITFGCSGEIVLDQTLTITTTLTIDGSGQMVTLDGHGELQDIVVQNGANLDLKSLVTAGGTASNGSGGDIDNEGGILNLTNVTVTGGTAELGGGGIANTHGGTTTVSNSTITGNFAPSSNGAGLFNNGGTMTLANSTVTGNSATNGGGLLNLEGTVTLTNSTVAGNSAYSGGGLLNVSTTTLTNSTVAENSAVYGGGFFNQVGTLTLTNSTVADNTVTEAGRAGGVYNEASLHSSGSIVAENSGGNCLTINGAVIDLGYNLETAPDCGFTDPSSLQVPDPLLASALADNGGPTRTLALLPDSPAIDAIPTASGLCPATDQRGVTRPDHGETACDIGAYEFEDADADLALTDIPADFVVDATTPGGAVVSYTLPTVVDEDSPPPTVTCDPAPGTTIPIGVTTVTCTVTDTDDANSPVSASFVVTVNGATEQVSNLITAVDKFDLASGIAASFVSQLQTVQADLAALTPTLTTSHSALAGTTNDRKTLACEDLQAFINHAKAQSGEHLTIEQASQMIAEAHRIQAVLAC